jgi:hypothetical protein
LPGGLRLLYLLPYPLQLIFEVGQAILPVFASARSMLAWRLCVAGRGPDPAAVDLRLLGRGPRCGCREVGDYLATRWRREQERPHEEPPLAGARRDLIAAAAKLVPVLNFGSVGHGGGDPAEVEGPLASGRGERAARHWKQ